MKVFGKIVKYFLISVVVIFNAIIIFRVALSLNKGELKAIEPTEALCAAYAEDENLEILTNKLPNDLSTNRAFTAYSFCYVPAAGEAQITVRINRGEYKKVSLPEGGEFTFSLRDTETDELTEGEILEIRDWMMYRYFRVSFPCGKLKDGVTYGMLLLANGEAEDEMIVRHKDQVFSTRSLTSGERGALSLK